MELLEPESYWLTACKGSPKFIEWFNQTEQCTLATQSVWPFFRPVAHWAVFPKPAAACLCLVGSRRGHSRPRAQAPIVGSRPGLELPGIGPAHAKAAENGGQDSPGLPKIAIGSELGIVPHRVLHAPNACGAARGGCPFRAPEDASEGGLHSMWGSALYLVPFMRPSVPETFVLPGQLFLWVPHRTKHACH